MKNAFVIFTAVMIILMAVDACAEKDDKKGIGEYSYVEVVESAGLAQSDWERAAKNPEAKEAEEDGDESENKEPSHI